MKEIGRLICWRVICAKLLLRGSDEKGRRFAVSSAILPQEKLRRMAGWSGLPFGAAISTASWV
jgi:hypothetical protein